MSVPHGWDAVTVSRAPLVEVRGSMVPDWDHPTTYALTGCNVQPSSTSRDFEGRALQTDESMTLFAPAGCGIEAGDRIGFDGRTYEVDGEPQARRSPTGRIDHVVCSLVEWRG